MTRRWLHPRVNSRRHLWNLVLGYEVEANAPHLYRLHAKAHQTLSHKRQEEMDWGEAHALRQARHRCQDRQILLYLAQNTRHPIKVDIHHRLHFQHQLHRTHLREKGVINYLLERDLRQARFQIKSPRDLLHKRAPSHHQMRATILHQE